MNNRTMTIITIVVLILLCVFVAFQVVGCDTHEQFENIVASQNMYQTTMANANDISTSSIATLIDTDAQGAREKQDVKYQLHINWNSSMMKTTPNTTAQIILQLYGHRKHIVATAREKVVTQIPLMLSMPIVLELDSIPTKKSFNITTQDDEARLLSSSSDITFHSCKMQRADEDAHPPFY